MIENLSCLCCFYLFAKSTLLDAALFVALSDPVSLTRAAIVSIIKSKPKGKGRRIHATLSEQYGIICQEKIL
jgi:hypothetical protein